MLYFLPTLGFKVSNAQEVIHFQHFFAYTNLFGNQPNRSNTTTFAIAPIPLRKNEAEGGCGVIGIACSEKIAARHLLQALVQMRNRGVI